MTAGKPEAGSALLRVIKPSLSRGGTEIGLEDLRPDRGMRGEAVGGEPRSDRNPVNDATEPGPHRLSPDVLIPERIQRDGVVSSAPR